MLQIFTSKKHLAIMAFAMLCTTANAQQKSVTLTEAGTLSKQIAATEKFNITDLTISGPINTADILFIRQMAGANNGDNEPINTGKFQKEFWYVRLHKERNSQKGIWHIRRQPRRPLHVFWLRPTG